MDNDDYILTDLESTNGTRVNGTVVQIRRLRFGDRVAVGRSLLLFGSGEEIRARVANLEKSGVHPFTSSVSVSPSEVTNPATVQMSTLAGQLDGNLDFDLNVKQDVTATRDAFLVGNKPLPPLPQKMSPSQAARLAEILDFF